jgi:hypothetical protein
MEGIMKTRVTAVFLALILWPVLFSGQASAQEYECGECFENPIAGLHQAPGVPGTGSNLVTNPHFISSDGRCRGFHEHYKCEDTEQEAELIASLKRGEAVELPALRTYLDRHSGRVQVSLDRNGIEVTECGRPGDVAFVPVPGETWRFLAL